MMMWARHTWESAQNTTYMRRMALEALQTRQMGAETPKASKRTQIRLQMYGKSSECPERDQNCQTYLLEPQGSAHTSQTVVETGTARAYVTHGRAKHEERKNAWRRGEELVEMRQICRTHLMDLQEGIQSVEHTHGRTQEWERRENGWMRSKGHQNTLNRDVKVHPIHMKSASSGTL